MSEFYEVRVRARTTYGVTVYRKTGDGPQGVRNIAENMALAAANEVARDHAIALQNKAKACDEVILREMSLEPCGSSAELREFFAELPEGSSVTFAVTAGRVEGFLNKPTPAKNLSKWSSKLSPTAWDDAKALIQNLPYEVVASMRRNAAEVGDRDMSRLLNEANVAVDA